MDLDAKTVTFVYFILAIINSAISAAVSLNNRHLRGVPEIAAAYIVGGFGLAIHSLSAGLASPVALFAANLLVSVSHGLGVNGLGVFLHRPDRRWLPISCAVYTILVWPPALYFAPDDRGLRIAAATLVTLVTFGYLLAVIRHGSRSGRWARRLIGALTVGHIAFALARAYWSLQGLPPSIGANAPIDVWSALESIVFSNTLFLCFLAMVGSRLNDDLRARNQALSDEITRGLRLERQLSSALANEVRLRAEQQQLIHIIGHEIRSPLAGIDRAAELLLSADPGLRRRVDSIRDRVRQTVGMIDRLLVSERDGRTPVRPEPLALDDVIGIVVRGFEDVDAARRIHVSAPERPVRLVADQGMMIAILRNLIENALKYSDGALPIAITAKNATDSIEIIVTDRGIGIPPSERDYIGQRFFRASNVGTIAGTGLGIFAVRRLLAAHGGHLAIGSGPDGTGTTMTVTLPLVYRSETEPVDA